MSVPTGPIFRVVTVGEEREVRVGRNVTYDVVYTQAAINLAEVCGVKDMPDFSDGEPRIQMIFSQGWGWNCKLTRAELVALFPPEWLS